MKISLHPQKSVHLCPLPSASVQNTGGREKKIKRFPIQNLLYTSNKKNIGA
jgi:hypothetical protein